MHMEGPSTYQQCGGFDSGILTSVRHHLKKCHFYNFDELLDALQHHDKVSAHTHTHNISTNSHTHTHTHTHTCMYTQDGTGHIPSELVHETCFQFNIPIAHDMLDMIIRWCSDGRTNRGVVYKTLVHLLNWKTEPDEKIMSSIAQHHPQQGTSGI